MGLLIFLLTFSIVAVIFLGIWMLVGADTHQDVIRRRMESVRKAERRGDVSLGLTLARDEMLSTVPSLNRMMLKWHWSVRLQEYIASVARVTSLLLASSDTDFTQLFASMKALNPTVLIAPPVFFEMVFFQ